MPVAEDLDLHVAGPLEVALDIEGARSEGGLGAPAGGRECAGQLARRVRPAPCRCPRRRRPLSGSGESPAVARCARHRRGRLSGSRLPGTIGTPAACIRRRASVLSPMARMASGVGPTKISPARGTGLGEAPVLGEKAISGMDACAPDASAAATIAVDGQITFAGGRRAEAAPPRRLRARGGTGIGFRVHGDGAQPKGSAGAEDPAGDRPPVGDQDRLEHSDSDAVRRLDAHYVRAVEAPPARLRPPLLLDHGESTRPREGELDHPVARRSPRTATMSEPVSAGSSLAYSARRVPAHRGRPARPLPRGPLPSGPGSADRWCAQIRGEIRDREGVRPARRRRRGRGGAPPAALGTRGVSGHASRLAQHRRSAPPPTPRLADAARIAREGLQHDLPGRGVPLLLIHAALQDPPRGRFVDGLERARWCSYTAARCGLTTR